MAAPTYVLHKDPARMARKNTILNISLGRYGQSATRFEQLWSVRAVPGEFELSCIPFFASDLALGDVVGARETGPDAYDVVGVLRKSGNRTARIVTEDEHAADIHAEICAHLDEGGYLYETLMTGFIVANVEPDRSPEDLSRLVAAFGPRLSAELL